MKFSLEYKEATNFLTICKFSDDSSSDCFGKKIVSTNKFDIANEINDQVQKKLNEFKFNLLGGEYLLSELDNIDYANLEWESDLNVDDIDINPTSFIIKNFPNILQKFTITKVDDDNTLLNNEENIFDESLKVAEADFKNNQDDFTKAILSELEANKDAITKFLKSHVENEFKDLAKELFEESVEESEGYTFLTTKQLTLKDGSQKSFNFLLLINDKINIKIYDTASEPDKALFYGPYESSISEQDFIFNILNQHDAYTDNSVNREELGKVYYMIASKINRQVIKEVKKEITDSIENHFKKIEEAKNTYSGQLVINKGVPLYKKLKRKKRTNNVKYEKKQLKLLIDSVDIRFFNNRADNLVIVGRINEEEDKTLILGNNNYSLPLREFNHDTQYNELNYNGEKYFYKYDDILDYLPYQKYNYAAKNGEVMVKEGDSVKVIERKIGDYFTGIFFSDFLGLNTNNSNGLIVAEGRIRIPWNLRNFGKWTVLDNITAYASVNLFNGFESSSRKIELEDTLDPDETSESNAAKFTTDNFNLLTNNNVDAGILVTPISFEWKGASTFIHLRYGLRFLRTGTEYNLKEQVTTMVNGNPVIQENLLERRSFQVYSIGQEVELNFEIRPQSLVGADVTFGINWFGETGTNKNDVNFYATNNSPNLKLMANIYSLTNSEESNSGVYFRLGGHYNLGTYKVFPQIMVGYATNLSSFVNKVKRENKASLK